MFKRAIVAKEGKKHQIASDQLSYSNQTNGTLKMSCYGWAPLLKY
jgi:hypothetical protein